MTRLTLRWRVLILIAVVHVLVMAGAGAILVVNAREAVKAEITAAQGSAVTMMESLVQRLAAAPSGASSLHALAETLIQPRHVRIRILPGGGAEPIEIAGPEAADDDDGKPAPDWFLNWVAPEVEVRSILVVREGAILGSVEIAALPEDESTEVWEDVWRLFLFWTLTTIFLLAALAVLIRQALAPLNRLEQALERLDGGDYDARASDLETPDLHPIGQRVDRLAETLQLAEAERNSLSQDLLNLRDSERRDIARDLHDELGPCLFGLTVASDGLRKSPESAAEHVETIDRLVAHIRSTHARILNSLRPPTIGTLPLEDVIADLVCDFRERAPDVVFEQDIGPLPRTCDTIDLTVYRILQEGMTNALRHGEADRIGITVQVSPDSGDAALDLHINDDGTGPPNGWRVGRGILGMRERVSALGGMLRIRPADGRGTVLHAVLPLRQDPQTALHSTPQTEALS